MIYFLETRLRPTIYRSFMETRVCIEIKNINAQFTIDLYSIGV